MLVSALSSRENILNFTNIIFQDIMSSILGDIEYNEEEYLNLGADYSEVNQDLKTEIDIINLAEEQENEVEEKREDEEQDRIEEIELEAKFVANKINELLLTKLLDHERVCRVCGKKLPWDCASDKCRVCREINSIIKY